jgi:hypothetical protein
MYDWRQLRQQDIGMIAYRTKFQPTSKQSPPPLQEAIRPFSGNAKIVGASAGVSVRSLARRHYY